MMVETEFGIPMSADKALSFKTVGDWRALLSAGSIK
jgi:acyl carrier protein